MNINTLPPLELSLLTIMDCMIWQAMCLNGVLTGMVQITMQNPQSIIQQVLYQVRCSSYGVVPGVILQLVCVFLVVLKSIQPVCLITLVFAVSKVLCLRTCLIEDVVDGGTTTMETVGFSLAGRVGSLEFELMHWLQSVP